MAFPYQCLQAIQHEHSGTVEWTLFGASGSRIISQASNGATSVWPETVDRKVEDGQGDEPQEPPGKKAKISHPLKQAAYITAMVISNDKQFLIAATAEDKCVHVFHIEPDARLQPMSQRCMPRRPCALTLTSDDSTILCADKFGDVYALPLLYSPEDDTDPAKTEEAAKPFVPAASTLTVHSGRNRKVLEEQIQQAKKNPPKPKEHLKFKHDLLLGHVSMLTDILYTSVQNGSGDLNPRTYILTADRDEHIRISRGPPQSHIIEGFCQGHEEFVSKLCLTRNGTLISGGGDNDLFLWDWLKGQLLGNVSIKEPVLEYFNAHPDHAGELEEGGDNLTVAVTSIWSIGNNTEDIVVGCEGVPALFCFTLRVNGALAALSQILPLIGNALDLTFIKLSPDRQIAVVSVDNLHKPGSTSEARQEAVPGRSLQAFSVQSSKEWEHEAQFEEQLQWFSQALTNTDDNAGGPDIKTIRSILYGMENLRKRGGADEE